MTRSGLEPTVRFDICESAVFTNFVIKENYSMWNNNLIQLLFLNAALSPAPLGMLLELFLVES